MPHLNLPIVTDWKISVATSPQGQQRPGPPNPSAPTLTFDVAVYLNNSNAPTQLRVETLDELSAIVGVLQIPGGRLYFDQKGQTLIKCLH